MTTPNEELLARLLLMAEACVNVPEEVVDAICSDDAIEYMTAVPGVSGIVYDTLREAAAALARQEEGREAESPEARFEHYVQTAIAKSPEPLRQLGEYLGRVLDEDKFPNADRLLLQLATFFTTAGQQAAGVVVSEDMIERAALAMAKLDAEKSGACPDTNFGINRVAYMDSAKAALTAAGAAPEGFVLVPREFTNEMFEAAAGFGGRGGYRYQRGCEARDMWTDLLAAAPNPGAQHGQEGR